MKKFILNFIVFVLLAIAATGCLSITRVDDKDKKATESEMVVTPTTIVNLRTGPGTNYQIVTGLQPGMELTVISNVSDEWMEVTTGNGMKGYVSSKYVTVLTKETVSDDIVSNDVITEDVVTEEDVSSTLESEVEEVENEVSAAPSQRYSGDSFFSSYMNFMTSTGGYILTLIIFFAEICVVVYLHNKYDYALVFLVPAAPAVIAIVISMALTVFQIFAIFSVRNSSSSMDPYFILMLLSTGFVMVDTPWRLRMSGLLKHCISFSKEGDSRVKKATMLGNVTWTMLLIPIAILYLQYAGYGPHKIFADNNSSFWSMVWGMILFGAGGCLFCDIIWPSVIVQRFLSSLNSKLLFILNIIMVFGIVKYEYYACDASFTGLNYLVSLFLLFLSACLYAGPMFSTINEMRCSNCHTFEGEHTHTTDLGSIISTSKEWEKSGTSGINPRNSGAVISDSEELVSTTKLTRKWKTHHTCAYCDHKWELERQSTEVIDSHVEKRRWKETYLK